MIFGIMQRNKDKIYRVLKTEIKLKGNQRSKAIQMCINAGDIWNLLVETFIIKQEKLKTYRKENPNDNQPWETDTYLSYFDWAKEVVDTFYKQLSCPFPMETSIKKGRGKSKGKTREVVKTESNTNKLTNSLYGLPAQSKNALCDQFEASIKSCMTHRKNGNFRANYPKKFKRFGTVTFPSQLVKRKGDLLILGTKGYELKIKANFLKGFELAGDVKLTFSRSGKFYLSVGTTRDKEIKDFHNVAAIDLGQKRSVVVSTFKTDGTIVTASISGNDINALKQERDNRYREINRQRSKIFDGHFRQYLTDSEKQTYRKLQLEDNERQRQGEARKGYDQRYARKIINQRRKEQGLRKYSKQDYKLKRALAKAAEYYRKRLDYANHCIAKALFDWLEKHEVGTVYYGDLSLPKSRAKGKRKIKQIHRNVLWEYPTQMRYLKDKMDMIGGEVKTHSEAYTSQTCPNCGKLNKPSNRNYHCKSCGWEGDRDGVGATNLLSKALFDCNGKLMPPKKIEQLKISPAIRKK